MFKKICHGGSRHPHSVELHSAACLKYKTIVLFILNAQYETELHNWCIKAMYRQLPSVAQYHYLLLTDTELIKLVVAWYQISFDYFISC